MIIDIVNYNTIKIIVSNEELDDFDLSYKKIDENDINTQMLLLYIIEEIKEQKNIDISTEKIYIEIFPVKSTGCLFYISILERKDTNKQANYCTTFTYKSKSINNIVSFCKQHTKKNVILNSELYFDETYFYIIANVLSEFQASMTEQVISTDICIKGELYADMIKEHYECICDTDAIHKINQLNLA